jgi:hypothetical protein
MISDRDDPQPPSAKTKEPRDGPPPSRWALLWKQLSTRDGTNQKQQPTTVRSHPPAASPTSASTSVGKLSGGLLGQFLGVSDAPSPANAMPAGAARVAPSGSTGSPQRKPTGGSGSPIRQAAASQVIDSPASRVNAGRASAQPAAGDSRGSPAVPDELLRAEQQLTAHATGTARTLWEQVRGTNDAENSTAPADISSGSQVAAPPARSAPPGPQTAGNGQKDNPWADLWRPMTMAGAAQQSASVSTGNAAAGSANARSNRPEVERVPRLFRPMFYMTNDGNSSQQSLFAVQNASSKSGPSLEQRVGDTSLMRQLALSGNQDLRTQPLRSDADTWEQTWTEPWLAATSQLTMTNEPIRPAARRGDVIQVAFLQDESMTPDPDELAPDKLDLPSDEQADGDAGSNNGDGEKKEGALAEAEKLGAEPEDNSLQFLRTQTVLLEPGETRFDIGLEYTLSEDDFPVLIPLEDDMVRLDEVHFKGRELTVPMELRYGLLKRVQLFLQVPIGWSNTQVSFDDFDAFANDGGLGDVSWGTTVQLQDATKDCPYVIGTLSATAPTGGDPFTGAVGVAPSAPSLGNGFWSVSGNLTWIRVYDPVVVYYGLGLRRHFSHTYLGLDIEPGPEYNYTLGIGFSVNEKVTLSTQFFGSYIEEIKVNGDRVEGSNQEPMSLRLAATFARPKDRLVEPFVTFGLTDDAVAANFGITWTF